MSRSRRRAKLLPCRPQAAVQRSKLVEFLKDSDILIIDTQYTDEKYQEHIGWGHGALSRVVSLALEAKVKKLFLFHHDPARDDHKIDEMLERARFLVVESGRYNSRQVGSNFVFRS